MQISFWPERLQSCRRASGKRFHSRFETSPDTTMENIGEKSQIDIDAMCRMCHQHLETDKSVEIFGDDSDTSLPISVQMKIFAGIDVSLCLQRRRNSQVTESGCEFYQVMSQQTDQVPKKLCLPCRLHLEKANLMRNKCKNLEAKLKKHFRIVNAGRGGYQWCEQRIVNGAEN